MKQWDILSQKITQETHPFNVEELALKDKESGEESTYHRLLCPNWVNVLPITSDNKAILIEQTRVGILGESLETPGGVIDPHEAKDPTLAAMRELEEETGFTSMRVLPLATVPANPAINSNLVHYFVALNCSLNPDRKHFPDNHERITIKAFAIDELEHMVRTGQVQNAYSCLCIMLALKYLKL